jgi:photosystem II stability/assembly factor-like uncharacterized protein
MRPSLKVLLPLLFWVSVLVTSTEAQPYSWTQQFKDTLVECVAFNPLSGGRTIFMATQMSPGVYRSDDGGATWANHFDGMNEFSGAGIFQVLCLESDTNIVLAITSGQGLYRSTNGGRTWQIALEEGGALGEALTYHRPSDVLFYGQYYSRPVWFSTDRGSSWDTLSTNEEMMALCTIAASQDEQRIILAGSGEGEISRSVDNGNTWVEVVAAEDPDETIRPEVPKIVWSQHATSVVVASRWLSEDSSLMRSMDGGVSWEVFGPDLSRTWALEVDQRSSHVGLKGPSRMWIGLFNRGLAPIEGTTLLETNDAGESWVTAGLPELGQVWMIRHDTTSNKLVAATSDGLYITTVKSDVKPEAADPGIAFTVNPASSFTELSIQQGERIRRIDLYDISGCVALTSATSSINTSMLPSGIYNARVVTDRREALLKLVVNR